MSLEVEDEVSHQKDLVLICSPWHSLVRILQLTKLLRAKP